MSVIHCITEIYSNHPIWHPRHLLHDNPRGHLCQPVHGLQLPPRAVLRRERTGLELLPDASQHCRPERGVLREGAGCKVCRDYRVAHLVADNLLPTSNWELHFSTRSIVYKGHREIWTRAVP